MTNNSSLIAENLSRVIRWFEKDGDALVGEAGLDKVDLPKLQQLFNVSTENPMYDCYPIKSKEQVQYIEERGCHSINPEVYDYFLECDNNTSKI